MLPWLNIIARGQSVEATDAGHDKECYLLAQETPAKLFLHADFRRKHANLSAGFAQVVKSTSSQWQWAESEGVKGSTTIRTVEDCRRFLLRIRRLPVKAGIQTSFLKPPLKQLGASLAAPQGGPAARSKWPTRAAA